MTGFSVNRLNQAGWLVYINGIEIPVNRAEVRFAVWDLPTLTLDVIPHPLLRRIGAEDRLQVALFYLDHHWEPGSPTFRLLGEFEVVKWGYSTSSRGRSVRLTCLSHLGIFDQLKFYYISSLRDIYTSAAGRIAGDSSQASVVKLHYPASLFMEGLTSPVQDQVSGTSATATEATDKFIKRPIDFVGGRLCLFLKMAKEKPDAFRW